MMEIKDIRLYKYFNYLFWHYIILEMSVYGIGNENRVNPSTIRNWLIKFNIPRRPLKEAQNTLNVKKKKSKSMSILWNRPGYRENHSGENHHVYGKCGKKSLMYGRCENKNNAWKDNVGYDAKHYRVRNKKPKPENCELCGKPEYYENLGKLELSNIKNHQYTDNPDDYQYVHRGCHRKFDKQRL